MRKDPFDGTWRLNVKASKLPFDAPRSVVLRIEVEEDRVRLTENSVSPGGLSENVEIEARFDDQVHPITGSAIAEGFAIHRINSHEWNTRGFKAGEVVFSAILEMSKDEKSFREYGETTLADGRKASVSLTYERFENCVKANGRQEV